MTSRHDPAVLDERFLRRALPLDRALITMVGASLRRAPDSSVSLPPMMQLLLSRGQGQTCVKAAAVQDKPYYCVKTSSIFPPAEPGMASEANGAVIVFESLTGRVVAVLVDNGYLTLMRTAAAGGFAVQQFAPAEIDTLGIVGAGKQAVLQAQAACLVRQPRSVLLWARNQAKAARAVAAISQETSRPVQLATEVDELASADVIIATTGARLPVLRLRDTTGASLILAIGSDAPGKRELHAEVIAAATAVVTDLGSQSFTHGELQGLPPETLAGRLYSYADGYTPSAGTTVVDHTGTGLQDLYVVDVVMQLVGSG